MKKKLLVFLCLVLAITLTGCGKKSAKIEEKEEKKKTEEKSDNFVVYYKVSDALDQIPTKELNGINYKTFSVKNGDALDIYTIAYNDTEVSKTFVTYTYGYADDIGYFAYNNGIVLNHSAYVIVNHYDKANSYSFENIEALENEFIKLINIDTFEYEKYSYEKKTLNMYFKFNGESKVLGKVSIIGLKDGEIIGSGETDIKKANDEGKVEPDGVISNKGDKGIATFQSIKLNFDLEDCDQILYFVNGYYE